VDGSNSKAIHHGDKDSMQIRSNGHSIITSPPTKLFLNKEGKLIYGENSHVAAQTGSDKRIAANQFIREQGGICGCVPWFL